MQVYTTQVTGSLQLPIFNTDPLVSASGNIWYTRYGGGNIKYSIASGSAVITRTLKSTCTTY